MTNAASESEPTPDPEATPAAVDRGPRRVARSRVAPIEAAALYALLADPRRHHELDGSATVGAAASGPERLSAGDAFTVAMHLGPIRYRVRSTVTEAVSDRVLEWRHPAGHRWRWELEPAGPGRTRVTEVFDYRGSRAPWLLELLRMPARNAAGIEATLARLG